MTIVYYATSPKIEISRSSLIVPVRNKVERGIIIMLVCKILRTCLRAMFSIICLVPTTLNTYELELTFTSHHENNTMKYLFIRNAVYLYRNAKYYGMAFSTLQPLLFT